MFGDGDELTEVECGLSPGEVRKWGLPSGTRTIALEPSHGAIEELLDFHAARGVEGGLTFENPRYENGQLCVDAHVWAKISVLGATAKFDQRFPVCINVGQPCFTVWEIGFANLQVCYRPPNQICGKLCVGKFGIEKCWEQCVAVPIRHETSAAQLTSHTCECEEHAYADSSLSRTHGDCVSVTINDGKACLNIPYAGSVCVSVPGSIPNGTVAEACIDTCKRFGILCGAKVSVRVAGQEIASQSWGCC